MFYKETSFKETPIGNFPKDWNIVKVGDLGEVITGTTPPTSVEKYWNGEYPFVTPTDITQNKYVTKTERKVTEKGLRKGRLIPKDTVLVTCIASIGKIALASEPCITNQQINAIICEQNVDPHYVFYAIAFRTNILRTWAGQTTNPIVKKSLFERFPLALPSDVSEQQKIASLLSIVDETIQKTDEVIVKAERLKRGLMQELLTKGTGHKQFKDTIIGKTPKEWNIVQLGDNEIAEIRSNKIITHVGKVAFIPMEAVPDSDIYASYEIRELGNVSSSTYCEAGDLLLAKITPSLENGKQGIVPQNVPNGFALATTEVYPIICKGIDPLFLFYILKFSKYRRILEFSMRGTTGRQRVPKKAVEKLKIPLPLVQEQQKIAEILLTTDKKLEFERSEKTKLEKVKWGLMRLLLTGKVRVKVDKH